MLTMLTLSHVNPEPNTLIEGLCCRLDDAGYVNLVGLKGGYYAWCVPFGV